MSFLSLSLLGLFKNHPAFTFLRCWKGRYILERNEKYDFSMHNFSQTHSSFQLGSSNHQSSDSHFCLTIARRFFFLGDETRWSTGDVARINPFFSTLYTPNEICHSTVRVTYTTWLNPREECKDWGLISQSRTVLPSLEACTQAWSRFLNRPKEVFLSTLIPSLLDTRTSEPWEVKPFQELPERGRPRWN